MDNRGFKCDSVCLQRSRFGVFMILMLQNCIAAAAGVGATVTVDLGGKLPMPRCRSRASLATPER